MAVTGPAVLTSDGTQMRSITPSPRAPYLELPQVYRRPSTMAAVCQAPKAMAVTAPAMGMGRGVVSTRLLSTNAVPKRHKWFQPQRYSVPLRIAPPLWNGPRAMALRGPDTFTCSGKGTVERREGPRPRPASRSDPQAYSPPAATAALVPSDREMAPTEERLTHSGRGEVSHRPPPLQVSPQLYSTSSTTAPLCSFPTEIRVTLPGMGTCYGQGFALHLPMLPPKSLLPHVYSVPATTAAAEWLENASALAAPVRLTSSGMFWS